MYKIIINNLIVVKKILKKILPQPIHKYFRLIYNILCNPWDFRRELNLFYYKKTLFKKTTISYTPFIFIARITHSCNLKCPTCIFILNNINFFKDNSFISVDKFYNLFEKYDKNKVVQLCCFTGGEPLLHPHIGELINIVNDFNAKAVVYTNGICILEKINSLKNVSLINISLNSYDYNSFQCNRGGNQKQFDSIISGFKLLKKNNIPFCISYLLHKRNITESAKLLNLTDYIQPNYVVFENIEAFNFKEYTPLISQDKDVMKMIMNLTNLNHYSYDIYLPVIYDINSTYFQKQKCIDPWSHFCFDVNGDVSPCCFLSHSSDVGNVFVNYDFNSPLMIEYRKRIINGNFPPECFSCLTRFKRHGRRLGYFNSKKKKWYFNKKVFF